MQNHLQFVIHPCHVLLDTVNLPLEPLHVFVDVLLFQGAVKTIKANRFQGAL